MKKQKFILLLLIIALFSLVGCNSNPDKDNKVSKNKKNISKEKQSKESKNRKKLKFKKFNTKATIEETILVDKNGIKIVAKDLVYNQYDVEVELELKNTSKKNISISAGTAGTGCNAINHFMITDGYLNVDLAKNESAKENISFNIKSLQANGITSISDIYITFNIEDEDYNDIYNGGKLIKTSLYKENNTNMSTYLETMKSGVIEDELSCDILKIDEEKIKIKDGIEVVSQIELTNQDNKKCIFVEVVNTSSEKVVIGLKDIEVDGVSIKEGMVDVEYMIPNSRIVLSMNLDNLFNGDASDLILEDGMKQVSYKLNIYNERLESVFEAKPIEFKLASTTKNKDSKSSKSNKSVEQKIYDEKNISITFKGIKENEEEEKCNAVFLVENKRRDTIHINLDEESLKVNNCKFETYGISETIKGKSKGVYSVELDYCDLEDNEIDEISNIEFKMDIENSRYESIAKPKLTVKTLN